MAARTTTRLGVFSVYCIAVGQALSSAVVSAPPLQLHFHDFWSTERSVAEIHSHVCDCMGDPATDVDVVSAEPPLVVIHDFLERTMCDDIVHSAQATNGMERSTTGAKQATTEGRTSSTVWLKDHECRQPLREMADKVSSLTGLPTAHMENLQVVRYEPGQEFNLHTDHQDYFNDLECRGRLATLLLYLSEPDAGGETWFPENDVRIAPKQGSAVFFWNTKEKPGSDGYHPEVFLNTDQRMRHAGLPVDGGEKWVCNRWIHPIDFGAGVRGVAKEALV